MDRCPSSGRRLTGRRLRALSKRDDAKWKNDGCDGAAFRQLLDREGRLVSVQFLEARPRIGETDSRATRRAELLGGRKSRAVVLYLQFQRIALADRSNRNSPGFGTSSDTVADCVLDDRLQAHVSHGCIEKPRAG